MDLQKMENLAWKAMLKLQHSSLGIHLIDGIYHSGLVDLYDDHVYRRDASHPSDEMLAEKQYFAQQKQRLSLNLSKLADVKSKEIYKRIIYFRCTHDVKKDRNITDSTSTFQGIL